MQDCPRGTTNTRETEMHARVEQALHCDPISLFPLKVRRFLGGSE